MDRERAEVFVRLLAEGELRRAAARPADRPVVAGSIARVLHVARALEAVGALDDELADQVLDDFEAALGTRGIRPPSQYRWGLRPGSEPGPAGADCAIAIGQTIPVYGENLSGEVTLLSYAQTEAGALLTFVARAGQLNPSDPDGLWETRPDARGTMRRLPVTIPFRQFTVTDERGTDYHLTKHGNGMHPGEWVFSLHPRPPRDLGWLDLTTAPGEPVVRIGLARSGRTAVRISQVTGSPAERLLDNMAMRLLTTGAVFPQHVLILLRDMLLEHAATPPDTSDGLGDVIAALQACDALPPLSSRPGQLAALCAQLDVTGHGIAVPPARSLPHRWVSLLANRERATARAAPERDGCVAVAGVLPDLDRCRLTILGLTNSTEGTILHTYTSGLMRRTFLESPEHNLAPALWIRDSRGDWHATRIGECRPGDITMRLQVVPPLSHGTAWIEVILAGQSAEVHATLPLDWQ